MISVEGTVSTIAGKHRHRGIVDGEGSVARFENILGLIVDDDDNMWVADCQMVETSELDEDGDPILKISTFLRKVRKEGSSYVTTIITTLNTTYDVHCAPSFTKEGDILIADLCGKVYIIKTGCPLPPHLKKLYHKEPSAAEMQLKAMQVEKGGLFDNAADNMADITFNVEGRSIPAHRGVVMASSEYFRTLFNSTMQAGDSSTTEVKETTYDALRTVLKYLYTKDHREVLTGENVLDVYELTERYTVAPLQDQCVWYMQSSSNLEAVVRWYIACKGKAVYERVQSILEGKLVKNFSLLGERHPDLLDELDSHDLLGSIVIGYFASKR